MTHPTEQAVYVRSSIPEGSMQYLFLAGRVLYGGFFLLAGIDHFRRVEMMTPYAAAKGIPLPRLAYWALARSSSLAA